MTLFAWRAAGVREAGISSTLKQLAWRGCGAAQVFCSLKFAGVKDGVIADEPNGLLVKLVPSVGRSPVANPVVRGLVSALARAGSPNVNVATMAEIITSLLRRTFNTSFSVAHIIRGTEILDYVARTWPGNSCLMV